MTPPHLSRVCQRSQLKVVGGLKAYMFVPINLIPLPPLSCSLSPSAPTPHAPWTDCSLQP